jgi:hypothetical protein
MTGPTLRNPVRPTQREAGQVMVKLRVLPEVLRVTFLTREQLSIVRIVFVMALATFLT